ncbi:MAG: M1 family metallopeptidase [Bacteroidetes bacterium]|nr:M1 family metallopeptidase [Bacteroidota bacterium]
MKLLSLCTIFLLAACISSAQMFMSRNFQNALKKNTRNLNGKPGAAIWQNHADYKIDVSYKDSTIIGSETISYANNSPDTLHSIWLRLYQNARLKNALQVYDEPDSYFTDGIFIDMLVVETDTIQVDNTAIHQSGNSTNYRLKLKTPLAKGNKVALTCKWHYKLNTTTDAPRESIVNDRAAFVAYFFPRIAAYDDVDGWNIIPFNEQIEFYNDFCNFDVRITVDRPNMVWATGELVNPLDVLGTKIYLWEKSKEADSPIAIVDSAEANAKQESEIGGTSTFHFTADNVTDFAFGVAKNYCWYGSSVKLNSGMRVHVQTAYHPEAKNYSHVQTMACTSIDYFSKVMPGIEYPYPQMTLFNGLGQMEFPMICNDVENENPDDDITLTTHEVSHTYMPFMLGTNEGRYAWMDEGWAVFFEYMASVNAFKLNDSTATYPDYYVARYRNNKSMTLESPIIMPSDLLLPDAYSFNSYGKPASAYFALRDYLGDSLFRYALQQYIITWNGKRPTPWDFFNCFNNATNMDLNWFWKNWFFDWGYFDWAVSVTDVNTITQRVNVENLGGKFTACDVVMVYRNGDNEVHHLKPGATRQSFDSKQGSRLKSVFLHQGLFIDCNLTNNKWEAK